MYKIAICDSGWKICSDLEEMFFHIQKDFHMELEIDVYYSGKVLQQYLGEGNYVDLIILDLELTSFGGLAIGKFLREELGNEKTKIVYMSSRENYTPLIFRVQTYDFLLKPVTEERLRALMFRLTHKMKQNEDVFQCKNGRHVHRILYEKILYFESEGHKVAAVLENGKMHFYNKLSLLIPEMPVNFVPIHKSFVINQKYVRHYAYEYVEMADQRELPISRTYRKEARKRLSGS